MHTANLLLCSALGSLHEKFGMLGTSKDRYDAPVYTVVIAILSLACYLFTYCYTFVQVSPHEFLQAVMKASKKRFKIGSQSDPVEFMSWLLNKLHEKLKSSKKKHSIIHECFQVCFIYILSVWTYPIFFTFCKCIKSYLWVFSRESLRL